MARRPRQHLDDVDRQLCQVLMAEPRSSVRDLAAHAGVTNETVTSRLRRLRESNVLALTVVVDSETAGYKAGAVVRIKAPRPAAALLQERFAAGGAAQFIAVAIGACDLVVSILGVDLAGVRATLRSAVRGVDNARVVGVDVVTGVLAYDTNALTLPIRPWSPGALPAPDPPLDELDCALIEQLSVAGHESNREIARRLEVSDATVRSRIRRLEDGGLMRLVAGVDPVAAGERRLFAMVFVSLDDESAIAALMPRATVVTGVTTIGAADLVLQIGGRSVHEVSGFVAELASVAGVRDVAVAYLTDVVLHHNHLARFAPSHRKAQQPDQLCSTPAAATNKRRAAP
jgi:DNA-binding Lrp family transcriptional regulator